MCIGGPFDSNIIDVDANWRGKPIGGWVRMTEFRWSDLPEISGEPRESEAVGCYDHFYRFVTMRKGKTEWVVAIHSGYSLDSAVDRINKL